MNLFDSVKKEHVLNAMKAIEANGLDGFTDSKYYDVLYQNKRYPPKPIMALAEEFATGSKISTSDFKGGEGTIAFKKLENLGFEIVPKNQNPSEYSFAPILVKFLKQARTENLKTREYSDSFHDLKVKVSFGQGVVARIPWISFLGKDQSTSSGIYPVYLYYKSENLLILAYGISETNSPSINWDNNGKTTITQYFNKLNKKPDRYGESYIFKVYNVDQLPSFESLDSDLHNLIHEYKLLLDTDTKQVANPNYVDFDYHALVDALAKTGLKFSENIVVRLIASLLAKPFVILTGLSGSGKTKLAQAFVKWICHDNSQYKIIPVGADWTNREPLLGFPNALTQNEYVQPDNGVLELILNAKENNRIPFFLILDEMNLSHVERYFADFLSAMESREAIHLHALEECNVPRSIVLPDNLFIIGTVNIDETTYMFSPKVLDRANTIEFRVNETELSAFLNNQKSISWDSLLGKGAEMSVNWVNLSRDMTLNSTERINEKLLKFFVVLKKAGAEFGYRTANEIHILLGKLSILNPSITEDEKLDIAIMQKLLPKLHGSRRKLEKVLFTLCKLCFSDGIEETTVHQYLSGELSVSNEEVLFPISLEKILRMYQGAIDHGFASYAEA